MSEYWPVLWVLVSTFAAGYWAAEYRVRRSIQYRMGQKVVDDIASILEQRKFTGEDAMTITSTTRWRALGHNVRLIIEHGPKENV